MAAKTLESWVANCQAQGKYTFLRAEAITGSGLSGEAVKKALQRLTHRKRVAKVKDYFYVIVPLEYSSAGVTPASWFIHDLMAAMKHPYYVGLLTAAGLHGVTQQLPQEYQVLTEPYVRPITVGRVRIRFFTSKFVGEAAVTNVKTPTGSMRASCPETTAVDLVRFARAAGYLDNVSTIIGELFSTLDSKKLLAAVQLVSDVPNAQRLGYILDHVRARQLAIPIHKCVEQQSPRLVPLRTGRSTTDARVDRRWHVVVNQPLEIEA